MNIVKIALAAGLMVSALSTATVAQQTPGGSMAGMDMKGMGPMQKDSMAAMEKMNKAMMEGMMDPNPDLGWMKGMAAHHQGAIDMSDAAIQHSKSSEVKSEAQKAKQENEKSLKELTMKMKKLN